MLARPRGEYSPQEQLALLPPGERETWLRAQTPAVLDAIRHGAWWWLARPKQRQPDGDWLLWLIRSGRGWGKNETASNTIVDWCEAIPTDRHGKPTTWLVVAHKLDDIHTANFGGQSGILNVLDRRGYQRLDHKPRNGSTAKAYTHVTSPKPKITLYPHGQIIYGDSVESGGADVGRNKNLAGAWLDEVAKWGPVAHAAWYEGLLPALRADLPAPRHPRCVVTTTPKPIGLLKEWTKRALDRDPKYRLTVGSTYENAGNLSPHSLDEFVREYEGTRRGRQELWGELLDEVEGALWTRDLLEKTRVSVHPPLVRVAVGVDPAGTGEGNETGIVVVGQGATMHQYVIADHSLKAAGAAAAKRAWLVLAQYKPLLPTYAWPVLVVEEDYGKKWLKDVLEVAFKELQSAGVFGPHDPMPVKYVKASLLGGKKLRAEPVAMRYETNRVHHVGVLHGLEDQQCTWDETDPKAHSPDRLDALVHASLWLRDQEPKVAETSTWLDQATLPVTQLTV